MPRRRVLIVDDDGRICSLIKRVVEGLGCDALPLVDPTAFGSAYASFEPDVVFLDLQMSGADGIELLRFLAERQATASVVLTSGVDSRVLDASHALGQSLGLAMGEPLRKPFEVADIRTRVDRRAEAETNDARPDGGLDDAALRQALEQGELALCYQPMIEVGSRRVTGVEALTRWHHPQRGLVMPGHFIPLAEDLDLIKPLTLWALGQAISDHACWSEVSPGLDLSVNLSPILLDDLDFPDQLEVLVQRHGFAPGRLILEVTEDRCIRTLANAMDVLARLRLKGFRLALDDFGTGYSSLDHLYRLPYGELKVDKTFVTNAVRDRHAATIVRVALELAHNVGLRVVAEGVEDARTLEWLAEVGCDVAQGLHISPPIELSSLMGWLETWAQARPWTRTATR